MNRKGIYEPWSVGLMLFEVWAQRLQPLGLEVLCDETNLQCKFQRISQQLHQLWAETNTFLLCAEEPKVLGDPHNLKVFLDQI